MSDPAYTRRYFSDSARRWLATAYVDGTHPAGYPLGSSRVRLALTAAVDRLGAACGRLVDVGGHRLHIQCTGSGSPTVVLEPGLGEPSMAMSGRIAPAG